MMTSSDLGVVTAGNDGETQIRTITPTKNEGGAKINRSSPGC
jgi:hypothetical protein